VTLDRFFAWADRRNIASVRAATLYITIWMTWRVTIWAFEYARLALEAGATGIDTAAVLGAVTIPFTALQVFAFRTYMEGNK
jgi:hypothetical protein